MKLCNHEPDPATIEYDSKHGRKAICKLCGRKIYITRFVEIKSKENIHGRNRG